MHTFVRDFLDNSSHFGNIRPNFQYGISSVRRRTTDDGEREGDSSDSELFDVVVSFSSNSASVWIVPHQLSHIFPSSEAWPELAYFWWQNDCFYWSLTEVKIGDVYDLN